MPKLPEWIISHRIDKRAVKEISTILRNHHLYTVCEEAKCPNIGECFGKHTATFLIMGDTCTRNCTFCNIKKGKPQPLDDNEPMNVAQAVKEMGLKYVVITSVTRDDLPDGGAQHYYNVVKKVIEDTNALVEVLVPDFRGDKKCIEKVLQSGISVFNHNVETVPSLYKEVRPMALYKRSLDVLKIAKDIDNNMVTKSGIMVGLGEKEDEVKLVMEDLRNINVEILTIGQYIRPTHKHHPVVEYIHPDVFEKYKEWAYNLGFSYVVSSPFVRSSYNAYEAYEKALDRR